LLLPVIPIDVFVASDSRDRLVVQMYGILDPKVCAMFDSLQKVLQDEVRSLVRSGLLPYTAPQVDYLEARDGDEKETNLRVISPRGDPGARAGPADPTPLCRESRPPSELGERVRDPEVLMRILPRIPP